MTESEPNYYSASHVNSRTVNTHSNEYEQSEETYNSDFESLPSEEDANATLGNGNLKKATANPKQKGEKRSNESEHEDLGVSSYHLDLGEYEPNTLTSTQDSRQNSMEKTSSYSSDFEDAYNYSEDLEESHASQGPNSVSSHYEHNSDVMPKISEVSDDDLVSEFEEKTLSESASSDFREERNIDRSLAEYSTSNNSVHYYSSDESSDNSDDKHKECVRVSDHTLPQSLTNESQLSFSHKSFYKPNSSKNGDSSGQNESFDEETVTLSANDEATRPLSKNLFKTNTDENASADDYSLSTSLNQAISKTLTTSNTQSEEFEEVITSPLSSDEREGREHFGSNANDDTKPESFEEKTITEYSLSKSSNSNRKMCESEIVNGSEEVTFDETTLAEHSPSQSESVKNPRKSLIQHDLEYSSHGSHVNGVNNQKDITYSNSDNASQKFNEQTLTVSTSGDKNQLESLTLNDSGERTEGSSEEKVLEYTLSQTPTNTSFITEDDGQTAEDFQEKTLTESGPIEYSLSRSTANSDNSVEAISKSISNESNNEQNFKEEIVSSGYTLSKASKKSIILEHVNDEAENLTLVDHTLSESAGFQEETLMDDSISQKSIYMESTNDNKLNKSISNKSIYSRSDYFEEQSLTEYKEPQSSLRKDNKGSGDLAIEKHVETKIEDYIKISNHQGSKTSMVKHDNSSSEGFEERSFSQNTLSQSLTLPSYSQGSSYKASSEEFVENMLAEHTSSENRTYNQDQSLNVTLKSSSHASEASITEDENKFEEKMLTEYTVSQIQTYRDTRKIVPLTKSKSQNTKDEEFSEQTVTDYTLSHKEPNRVTSNTQIGSSSAKKGLADEKRSSYSSPKSSGHKQDDNKIKDTESKATEENSLYQNSTRSKQSNMSESGNTSKDLNMPESGNTSKDHNEQTSLDYTLIDSLATDKSAAKNLASKGSNNVDHKQKDLKGNISNCDQSNRQTFEVRENKSGEFISPSASGLNLNSEETLEDDGASKDEINKILDEASTCGEKNKRSLINLKTVLAPQRLSRVEISELQDTNSSTDEAYARNVNIEVVTNEDTNEHLPKQANTDFKQDNGESSTMKTALPEFAKSYDTRELETAVHFNQENSATENMESSGDLPDGHTREMFTYFSGRMTESQYISKSSSKEPNAKENLPTEITATKNSSKLKARILGDDRVKDKISIPKVKDNVFTHSSLEAKSQKETEEPILNITFPVPKKTESMNPYQNDDTDNICKDIDLESVLFIQGKAPDKSNIGRYFSSEKNKESSGSTHETDWPLNECNKNALDIDVNSSNVHGGNNTAINTPLKTMLHIPILPELTHSSKASSSEADVHSSIKPLQKLQRYVCSMEVQNEQGIGMLHREGIKEHLESKVDDRTGSKVKSTSHNISQSIGTEGCKLLVHGSKATTNDELISEYVPGVQPSFLETDASHSDILTALVDRLRALESTIDWSKFPILSQDSSREEKLQKKIHANASPSIRQPYVMSLNDVHQVFSSAKASPERPEREPSPELKQFIQRKIVNLKENSESARGSFINLNMKKTTTEWSHDGLLERFIQNKCDLLRKGSEKVDSFEDDDLVSETSDNYLSNLMVLLHNEVTFQSLAKDTEAHLDDINQLLVIKTE